MECNCSICVSSHFSDMVMLSSSIKMIFSVKCKYVNANISHCWPIIQMENCLLAQLLLRLHTAAQTPCPLNTLQPLEVIARILQTRRVCIFAKASVSVVCLSHSVNISCLCEHVAVSSAFVRPAGVSNLSPDRHNCGDFGRGYVNHPSGLFSSTFQREYGEIQIILFIVLGFSSY